VSAADTVTRIYPPPAVLTDDALHGLNPEAADLVRAAMSAESPTLEVEDARPLDRVEYRGRHRTDEEVTRGIPAATLAKAAMPLPPRPELPDERTALLLDVMYEPPTGRLPARAQGAALAAERTRRLQGNSHRLAGIMRALPRFPWGGR